MADKVFKIAIVCSAYPQLAQVASLLTKKRNFEFEVKECVFDEAVKESISYEKKGYDLIISRSVSGTLIKNAVNIPVVLVETTNFDFLDTIHRARQVGKRIACFEYRNHHNKLNVNTIAAISGLDKDELLVYQFGNEIELRTCLKKAVSNERVDVIVASGSYMFEIARSYGTKTMMVHSTTEAIYDAFHLAFEILQGRERDRKIINILSSSLNAMETGLISVDASEKITHINRAAELLLNVKAEDFLNRNSSRFKLFNIGPAGSHRVTDTVINYAGEELSLKHEPLINDDGFFGKVIKIEQAPKSKPVKYLPGSQHHSGLVAKYHFNNIICESVSMNKTILKAKTYALSDSSVLITGESGTGKELLANSIHNYSRRAKGPFVAINCASIPESLLESELFGYDEGSFTGARKGGKVGLFEMANTGSIFLDEISDISIAVQARLLRVLQEKEVMRIGGKKNIPLDIRVIAATNVGLPDRIREGRFREDLYFRLNVFNLEVPPLRNRKEDIPMLARYFLRKFAQDESIFSELLMEKLKQYSWPGNVRELESFIEKYIVLRNNRDSAFLADELYEELSFLGNKDLAAESDPGAGEPLIPTYTAKSSSDTIKVTVGTFKEMEQQIMQWLYNLYGKDKTRLAKELGISRTTVWKKLKDVD